MTRNASSSSSVKLSLAQARRQRGAGGHCLPPIFVFAPPDLFLAPHGIFWEGKCCCFCPEKTLKFVISARKSLRKFCEKKPLKRFRRRPFLHQIFTKTFPQSNSGIMKIWVKFNAGFQLCPPDFNFAPPPNLAKLATPLPWLWR